MKLILSRKGFDSSAGQCASPIFPSGELCSLPIPEPQPTRNAVCYQDIQIGNHTAGKLVADLTQGKITPRMSAHLDPDLVASHLPRPSGWKPLFGQAGAAEGHLQKSGVGPGDIFLFYGWFRRIEEHAGRYRYVKAAPNLHVIFGWLQVERRVAVAERTAIPAWALDHAHCRRLLPTPMDSLYIATDHLNLPSIAINQPGGGIFQDWQPTRTLTAVDAQLRSHWHLPAWFHPEGRRSSLSYHDKPARWTRLNNAVQLQTVGRGQEFILDCDNYPEAIEWLAGLFV